MDLTKNPLENAQSLLDNARADRRSQRRRNDTSLLFNLAGQILGGVLQGRQQEKFTNFMNTEGVLQERALVRSAVDKAQGFADRARTAASYAGGKRAFFDNELNQTYEAQLQSTLGKDGSYYDQANVKKIAETLTAQTLDEYIKNFDTQLTAAQNVLTATGGDRLAYAKALREASGLDQGVIGRGLRKLTSLFRDEDDRDTDSALYKSTTSSRIYAESQKFQETFDKFYTATGNSLVATKIAEYVEENKNNILKATMDYEDAEIKRPDMFGNMQTMTVAKEMRGGKWTGTYVDPFTKLPISEETFRQSTASSAVADKDFATNVLLNTRQANRDLESDLDDFVMSFMPDSRQFEDTTTVKNAALTQAGTALHLTNLRLSAVFDKTDIPDSRLRSIAARSRILDMKSHDGRPTLLNPSADNPLLTYHATIEEYGGIDDVPQGIREVIENEINTYMNVTLPSQSTGRLEEVMKYVEKNRKIFSNLDQQEYSLLDVLDMQLRQKLGISDEFRRMSPKEASLLSLFRD
tara:strand:+ start:381 stop:1949 length:1569 start_codon:yes stop_codon:yes gene_type:complete